MNGIQGATSEGTEKLMEQYPQIFLNVSPYKFTRISEEHFGGISEGIFADFFEKKNLWENYGEDFLRESVYDFPKVSPVEFLRKSMEEFLSTACAACGRVYWTMIGAVICIRMSVVS